MSKRSFTAAMVIAGTALMVVNGTNTNSRCPRPTSGVPAGLSRPSRWLI
jgi:hypothetical protein